MLQPEPVLLEDWMRAHYFATPLDLGSSGVSPYSLGEAMSLVGLEADALLGVAMDDAPTLGGDALRQAIAGRFGLGDLGRVMVTNGSNEAGFFLINSLLRPGDQIVAMAPIYHTLAELPRMLGCEVVPWPLRWADGFAPDLDALAALIGPRTRMICVNFPHNPTGVTITRDQQLRLCALADAVGAYLVWDAAFRELTWTGAPLPEPLLDYPRAIATGTLSKCYGLPGARIGWVLAEPEVLAPSERIKDYLSLYVSPVLERIAAAVLDNAEALIKPRRRRAAANLERVRAWIDAQSEHVEWVAPGGGVTAFPRLRALADTRPLCLALAREAGVMLVPGDCFGHPGHVRLGFGGPSEDLGAGLARVAEHLGDLQR